MLRCKRLSLALVFFSGLLIAPLCQVRAQGSEAAAGQVRAETGKDAVRQQVFRGDREGYLGVMPSSISLLPPSPALRSAAQDFDDAVSRQKLRLKDTPRWRMAIDDADLTFPRAASRFSCALDAPITEQETPHLYQLIRRSLNDVSRAVGAAKERYHRERPFAVNHEDVCTPKDKEALGKNGSYPSGHAATGWVWALILSEVAPDRMDAILARGLAFGQSRVVCNVHWESDVIAGTLVGAAVVARLHADAAFMADLAAAKAEVAAVRAKGLKPLGDCAAEARAYRLDGTDDDITSLRGGAGANQ